MVWDASKSPGDLITSSDWNDMVSDQKAHGSRHEDGGVDEISVENFATSGASGTVPISQGDGSLQMDAAVRYTSLLAQTELASGEMIQNTRFTAPSGATIKVFGGSITDSNGDAVAQETELELFNHTTGNTMFVIDQAELQSGNPLYSASVGGDDLEIRTVNATSTTKNLSSILFFNVV